MPSPTKTCKKSKPIKLKVKSGSTKTRRTQPVAIAPNASKVINNPKITLKRLKPVLSICLKRNLFIVI
jgi:hypothetical protein